MVAQRYHTLASRFLVEQRSTGVLVSLRFPPCVPFFSCGVPAILNDCLLTTVYRVSAVPDSMVPD